eukprot:353367-Chlamydomonas_euryale.AAC.9
MHVSVRPPRRAARAAHPHACTSPATQARGQGCTSPCMYQSSHPGARPGLHIPMHVSVQVPSRPAGDVNPPCMEHLSS